MNSKKYKFKTLHTSRLLHLTWKSKSAFFQTSSTFSSKSICVFSSLQSEWKRLESRFARQTDIFEFFFPALVKRFTPLRYCNTTHKLMTASFSHLVTLLSPDPRTVVKMMLGLWIILKLYLTHQERKNRVLLAQEVLTSILSTGFADKYASKVNYEKWPIIMI